MTVALVGVIALAIGVVVGVLVRKMIATGQAQSAESRAQKVVLDAQRQAETIVREALVEVKDEIAGMRKEAEVDVRTRREEIQRREGTITQREEALERRAAELERFGVELDSRAESLSSVRAELEHAAEKHRQRLETVAQMTAQEAKEALVVQIVDAAKRDAMATVRDLEQRAREEGEERARKIVTIAIQRVASEQ
ncbi:MAG: Rnase Y domain-containing protein, partial [Actinomycetota bacterium]